MLPGFCLFHRFGEMGGVARCHVGRAGDTDVLLSHGNPDVDLGVATYVTRGGTISW